MRLLRHRLLRIVAVFAAVWGVLAWLGLWLRFGAGLPPWVAAVGIALAVELVVWLYAYERQAAGARRGMHLLALRLVALACVAWILLAPVWSRQVEKKIDREVVVLLDDSASMHLVDEGERASRLDLGRRALDESGLLASLDGRVRTRTMRVARRLLGQDEEAAEGWNQATDLAAALDAVLAMVPPDQLAGAILLTDGRHNRPGRVEDVARRFGILDAPVGVVATGSPKPPRDAAVVSVEAPDTLYLGDRARIAARLKFDGYAGKSATIRLLRGDRLVEEKTIPIPQDGHREELRFQDTPAEGGVAAYRLEIAPLDNERFPDNNRWAFETAVTDARTHVLLVDSFPRWDFRYLRNLFYGRDKSVHLQYVLFDHDRVAGQEDDPVPASASRRFGDAAATALPASDEEWRKFDVIILGDVGPDRLGAREWTALRKCVTERGALLVTVAGPRWMPHAFTDPVARELLPVAVEGSTRTYFQSDTPPFRMALTSAGRDHPVAAQSDSLLENEQLWAGFPVITWRHPVTGLAPGAEVLLYAGEPEAASAMPASADDLGGALKELAGRRAEEARRALLVVRQTGNGKVAALMTDHSWRLREGVGDTFHHRFWGQLVRWGAGPVLRAGSASVRLGTDQLTYTGDDTVRITARLRDHNLEPVKDRSLKAIVRQDGRTVATVPLAFIEGSNGLHEAAAGPFPADGQYVVRLEGSKLDTLGDGATPPAVETGFRVVGARSPVELSETTLNRPLIDSIAALSGGRAVDPAAAASLAPLFLDTQDKRTELRETTLWDHWIVLVLLVGTLTTEWIIRRNHGLP